MARLFFLWGRRCTRYVLLIVVVEILRFGANAPKARDDRVRKEGRHDEQRKSSGIKPLLHQEDKDKRARFRCGTW